MTKEKQIEEMAKAMCWEGADCSKCDGLLTCDKKYYAPRLVEKGYRKSSEVAREIFEEIEKIAMHGTTPFGLCLMSMGEVAFAQLKKKYITEEGK
jgi:hypothetical protein